MTLRRASIEQRLQEINAAVEILREYTCITEEDLASDLRLRWMIERGLLTCASMILEVCAHILASVYGQHPDAYEDAIQLSHAHGIISDELYGQLRGLGGFRNVLVHEYIHIKLDEVRRWLLRATKAFPQFVREIVVWLTVHGYE